MQINLQIGNVIEPEPNPTNQYVLVAKTMLGDADFYEDFTLIYSSVNEEEVEELKQIIQIYEWFLALDWNTQCTTELTSCLLFRTEDNKYPDIYYTFDDFPSDPNYGNSYHLLSYEVFYFDDQGQEYKVNVEISE